MKFLNGQSIRACFLGHSHLPSLFRETGSPPCQNNSIVSLATQNCCLMSPGAVGEPHDRDPRAAFGVPDRKKLTFEFCHAPYNISACWLNQLAWVDAAGECGDGAGRGTRGLSIHPRASAPGASRSTPHTLWAAPCPVGRECAVPCRDRTAVVHLGAVHPAPAAIVGRRTACATC